MCYTIGRMARALLRVSSCPFPDWVATVQAHTFEDYTCSNLASFGKVRGEQGEELLLPTWLKDKEVTSVRNGVHGTRSTQER